jgi:hypothetical protein
MVACTRPDDMFCQLQLLGLPVDAGREDVLPRLTSLLEGLAAQQRLSGEVAPPAQYGIEFHQLAAEFVGRAA